MRQVASAVRWAGTKIILVALALYHCLRDPDTPSRYKAILAAALGYFVVPLDAIPDLVPVFGYSDDMGALALVFAALLLHMKPVHRRKARVKLAGMTRADHEEDV